MEIISAFWEEKLCGAIPAEGLPGPDIQGPGDVVELVLGVDAQVRALGQILPEQAIRVLVDAALPGAVRVGELDRHARVPAELLVRRHLPALVVGQAPRHLGIMRASTRAKLSAAQEAVAWSICASQ